MKKFHRERKIYVERAGIARWRNALKRRDIKYDVNKFYKDEKFKGRRRIVAPKYLSVYDFEDKKSSPYVETLRFLAKIEREFKKEHCYVDFRGTAHLSAAAMVVLYAAIDLASKEAGRDSDADILWSNSSERVNAVLKANNFHKLIRGHHISYSLDSVRSMPVISSVGSDQMEEVIDFIQRRIYKEQMSPDTEHVYGDAVSETINNVRLHAYPDYEREDKKWWLVCTTIGKMLYLAIYDKGIGIPKTVVDRPWFWSSVKHTHPEEYALLEQQFPAIKEGVFGVFTANNISDERLIFLSMQGDVTGTKTDKHGQGSKSIMALVNDTPGGQLWVFSNGGLYQFRQADTKPGLYSLPKKFPGTLVQWNIELP